MIWKYLKKLGFNKYLNEKYYLEDLMNDKDEFEEFNNI